MKKMSEACRNDGRLRKYATIASIAVAMILVATKLVAYRLTNSVALLTSLFDSGFDLISSLVTAYGVMSALRPPDYNHRYGHGKAEPLASLVQAVFIIASSSILAYEAIGRFFHPSDIANEHIGYIVMILAAFLTTALVFFQNYVVRKTQSSAIRADRMHYTGDLAINLAVITAFALYQMTGLTFFDPLLAIAIALGLFFSAFRILKRALYALMDEELPDEERDKILLIVKSQAGVMGVHDMRTRSDSDRIFIELHVEMDGNISLRDAHKLSEKIEAAVRAQMPKADVIVHQDPAGLSEERRDGYIEETKAP